MPFEFHSRRSAVVARHCMIATSQPLASMAGARIFIQGGNAADAAVAIAATLNVLEPGLTGIGGDCFALYYNAKTGEVTALNGSGRTPAALSLDLLAREGFTDDLPPFHAHTITVPGACAGWCDLIARHGSLALSEVLEPAIRLAEEGFPVAPMAAVYWHQSEDKLKSALGGTALLSHGRSPQQGEVFHNRGLAHTLRVVAAGGKDAFYKGEIARSIVRAVQEAGGVMAVEDLAGHVSTWDTPISTVYRGIRVWESPPNSHGLTALMALNLLEGYDLASQDPMSAERWHTVIEAMRIAFSDVNWYVADPQFQNIPLDSLLSKTYARARRTLIRARKVADHLKRGVPSQGSDTVYFCAVDEQGNACSFINSNFMAFGTGIVPEGCGFALQNRGANFSIDRGHPNALAPRKRPYHTLMPGLMTREADGSLFAPFGVTGGFMQPQGQVQVVIGMIDDRLDPQDALDRPRFLVEPVATDGTVQLEADVPLETVHRLEERGHHVKFPVLGHERAIFGRGQVIYRGTDGVLWGGSDPRSDGCAIGL